MVRKLLLQYCKLSVVEVAGCRCGILLYQIFLSSGWSARGRSSRRQFSVMIMGPVSQCHYSKVRTHDVVDVDMGIAVCFNGPSNMMIRGVEIQQMRWYVVVIVVAMKCDPLL